MITRETALEVFETIERMLMMTDTMEEKSGTRDWGDYFIPGTAQVLSDILNNPEELAEVLESFSAQHPPKMFLDDFMDRTWDLNVPYTEEGRPKFDVADFYGEDYEDISWFDSMTNEQCGYSMPPVSVTVEYEDYSFEGDEF